MKIFIDGKYYDERDAKISVFDHGLLYGDGIFEGIRAYHGRVFKLKEHIDRLFYSAKAILLEIPMSPAQIMRATVETCRKNKIRDGYIRLVVTRGVGTLGLNPRAAKIRRSSSSRTKSSFIRRRFTGAAWTSSRCRRRAICTARSTRPSSR
jgi:branched-subunit amino acid aminotransferase/4-amino-4-deoxychorismate lyase